MERKSYATYVLIGINVIWFAWLAWTQQSIMMNREIDALAILHAGANFNPYTLGGEPWRLVTSMFLHFGIIHLAVNMFALFNLGRYLEPSMGTARFLLLYFFCGIAAGLASLILNVFSNSAGASGAIFGLYGYWLAVTLIVSFHDRAKRNAVLSNFAIFVVINAFITFRMSVDLAGHIGGCLAGILIGVFHFKFRWLVNKQSFLIVVLVSPMLIFLLPKDQLRYYQIFQQVIRTERTTNKFLQDAKTDAAQQDSLMTLVTQWDSIQVSLNELSHVPARLTKDTATLARYAKLRKEETIYHVKLLQRDSYIYQDSIDMVLEKLRTLTPLDFHLNYEVSETDPEEMKGHNTGVSHEPIQVYYDSAWREMPDQSHAMYYRIGTRDSIGRWQGFVRDHYKNGDIQMKGVYTDGLKDGIFLYYSNHKTYTSVGRYDHEQSVGKWELFHWNGALQSEIFYNNGAYTLNAWDSLGNLQVSNGNGTETLRYADGKVKEEGAYKNGRREGVFRGFHPDGKPYYQELYRDGYFVKGLSITRDGKRYEYDQSSLFSMPETGMEKYRKYIDQNKKNTPASEHGTVKVLFMVGDDGSRWDYVILQQVSPACDEEAVRLIKEGPPWRPAFLHGHEKTQSQGYVEVPF